MKRILFSLLSLPITILADSGLPSQPYLYVHGFAQIERPADMVNLRFDFVARNVDQGKANQEVQAKANKVLALLDSKKIAPPDVVASDLKSEPQYEEVEGPLRKRGKFIGYSVTRSFSVQVRDIAIFPKLVDDLLAMGGAEFSGIYAGLSQGKAMEDEIWGKALTNARARAEKTLKEMGMKIDSVFAVSPIGFPEIQQEMFGSTGMMMQSVAPDVYKRELVSSQYRLAPVTITQNVHVIYLISPAK